MVCLLVRPCDVYSTHTGVGKAAEHPPALVVLSLNASSKVDEKHSVVWVGKGIVYDTGGLSIKTKTGTNAH